MKAAGQVKPCYAAVWLQSVPSSPDEPHPQLNGLTLSPVSAGDPAPKGILGDHGGAFGPAAPS